MMGKLKTINTGFIQNKPANKISLKHEEICLKKTNIQINNQNIKTRNIKNL